MSQPTITAKTRNAEIVKIGHTAGSKYGGNDKAKTIGTNSSRDQSIR